MPGVAEADAYLATPSGGKGQGVLVIHAWWGLNDFFCSVCDRLASDGFVALAPDLFEGRVASTIQQARKLRSRPRKEPTHKTLLRAIDRLQGLPQVQGRSMGVIGFSMGGHWALWLAANHPELRLKAVTTFYGARAGDYRASPAAFQGHFAEDDPWVSASALKKLRQSLELAPRGAEVYIYPGTGHWFFESDRDEAYHRQASELAWRRTRTFLRKHLKA